MNLFQPSDVGTRYQHYGELLDLWENTLECFDSHTFHGKLAETKKAQLIAGIDTLRKQIDILTGYDDSRFDLRRMIDRVHNETKLEV